jgi:hypothetical protein
MLSRESRSRSSLWNKNLVKRDKSSSLFETGCWTWERGSTNLDLARIEAFFEKLSVKLVTLGVS